MIDKELIKQIEFLEKEVAKFDLLIEPKYTFKQPFEVKIPLQKPILITKEVKL